MIVFLLSLSVHRYSEILIVMLVYPTLQVKCKSVFGSLVYLSNSDGIDNLVDNLRNIGILCVLISLGGGGEMVTFPPTRI